MSGSELSRLEKTESEILAAGSDLLCLGRGLDLIREQGLFRFRERSFSRYVLRRWGIKRAHAYRLMSAARFYDQLQPLATELQVTLPRSERQLRLLRVVGDDVKCCQILERAKQIAAELPIQYRHIREAIREYRNEDEERFAETRPPVVGAMLQSVLDCLRELLAKPDSACVRMRASALLKGVESELANQKCFVPRATPGLSESREILIQTSYSDYRITCP